MKLDQSGELVWGTPAVLSLAHGTELKGSDDLRIAKKLSGNSSLNPAKVRALGWPLPGIFLREVCGANYL